jgi:hypothetical protein
MLKIMLVFIIPVAFILRVTFSENFVVENELMVTPISKLKWFRWDLFLEHSPQLAVIKTPVVRGWKGVSETQMGQGKKMIIRSICYLLSVHYKRKEFKEFIIGYKLTDSITQEDKDIFTTECYLNKNHYDLAVKVFGKYGKVRDLLDYKDFELLEDIALKEIPEKLLLKIGDRVWNNESRRNEEELIVWNEGEPHASLGYMHFIWYPVGYEGIFVEDMPRFLAFFEKQGEKLPNFLVGRNDCLWFDRNDLLEAKRNKSQQFLSMKEWLKNTEGLQIKYVLSKLEQFLVEAIQVLPDNNLRSRLVNSYHKVYTNIKFPREVSYSGAYALIDYVNFKGNGLSESEKYNGEGWGLLQVLLNMNEELPPLESFAEAARLVLKRRVNNAPKSKWEEKWLPGWLNRVATYVQSE